MYTFTALLAVVSICLFFAGCAIFIGGKLAGHSAEAERTGVKLDLVPHTLTLMLASLAVGTLAVMVDSPLPNLDELPATAAGMQRSGEIQRASQFAIDGTDEALDQSLPELGRFELAQADRPADMPWQYASMDLLAERPGRYLVVVETRSNPFPYDPAGSDTLSAVYGAGQESSGALGKQGERRAENDDDDTPASMVATGILERVDGDWRFKIDFGSLPPGFPRYGREVDVRLQGSELVLNWQEDSTSRKQVWRLQD